MKKLFTTLVILLSVYAINAQTTYYWNGASPTQTTAPVGGTGTWTTATSTTNWLKGTSGAYTITDWVSAANATATLGAYTGSAATVTLAKSITAGTINVNANNYTVLLSSSSTITSPIVIGANDNLTLNPSTNTLTLAGNISAATGGSVSITDNQATSYGEVVLTTGYGISCPVNISNGGAEYLDIQTTGTGTFLISGPLAFSQTGTGAITFGAATAATNFLELTGAVTGNAALDIATGTSGGKGTTWFNAATAGQNTFYGDLYMNSSSGAGGLRVGSGSPNANYLSGLSTSAPYSNIWYTVAGYGGYFDLYGANVTINQLSQTAATAAGAITNTNGGSSANTATLTVTQNTSTTLGTTAGSVIIQDGNSTSSKTGLTMASANGAGILTLNGANTYTGPTTVTSGSLFVDNTSGLASGSTVTVNGGTFGGNGTAAGTININNGGAIAPGASGNGSEGTFTTGAQNWAAGAIYNVDINALSGTAGTATTWDLLSSTGAVTLPASGNIVLNVTGGSGVSGFANLTGYTWKILTTTGGISNFNASNFTINVSGFPTYTGAFTVTNPNAGEIDLVYTAPVAAFTINPTSLTSFSTVAGTASTPAQSFTLAGNNLNGSQISITPAAGYEISTTSATSGFQGSGVAINLTNGSGNYTSPNLTTVTVWVRIASAASAGTLSGSIAIAGGGVAMPGSVTLSGNVLASQPVTQASNIVFSGITTNGFTVNWTDGNGANQAVVVSTVVIVAPANGNDYATVNNNYSTSLTYGTTNHVVAAGAITGATGVTVTGLTPGTTYNVEVFDYNGSAGSNNYNTTTATLNPASQLTPLPTYYWNGASPAQTTSASGGNGTWNATSTNWLTAATSGVITAWPNTTGYSANFGSAAGIVTLGSNVAAGQTTFGTTGYTLTNTASTDTLRSPIILGSGVSLNVAPNSANNFTYFGNISGGAGSGLALSGNTLTGSNYVRVNLAQANSTISVPVTVTMGGTSTSTNYVGLVAVGSGITVSGNIDFASTVGGGRITLAATSGNGLNVTGQVTGTGDIQYSAGSNGGAGTVTLSNTSNNFTGNLYMIGATSGKFQASAGAGSCVPATFGLYYPGYTSGNPSGGMFDLNGSDVTIGTLSQTGTNAATVGGITNSATGTATNTLTINQSSATNFNLPIADGTTAHTAVKFTGTGTLNLGAVNTFTGGLTLNNGIVQMGASGNIFVNTMPITFNGGQFSTGATSGYSETLGALNLTASSSINLGTGAHSLKFANSSASNWTGTLTVYGWQGTATDTGTAGRLYVGTDNTGLTSTQLLQVSFNGYGTGALILSTGEIVPASEALSVNTTGFTSNFGNINLGSSSAPQSFVVYGSGLNSTVTITAPAGFQISQNAGSGFSSSPIVLTTTGGVLSNTTIYVEFVPVTAGAASGAITAVSGTNQKNISVSGTGIVTAVYSQGSGKAATDAIWSYLPVGAAQTITQLGGFASTINVVIQNGHTVTTSVSQEITAKNLTINSGGVLKELTSSSTAPYYINLNGNLIVNGQLGALNGADSLGINANGANDTITGNGAINLQRIRNNNASTNLVIDANMNLWWIGASIYNNVASSTYNVTLNAGKTINFEGQSDISVNGIAGATASRGGVYTINGTMTGLDTVYAFASAAAYSTSGIVIGSTGLMSANFVKVGIGGTGNFSFSVNSGGQLEVNKVLQLQTGTFAPVGTVVMKSTSVNQAAIIDNFSVGTFNGTYTGNITAQRYYEASTTYTQQHEMGSPVNTPSLAQFGATAPSGNYVIPNASCSEVQLAAASPYGTVFSYNENAPGASTCAMAEWYVEPSSATAANGVGYSILNAGPGTLQLTGTPNLAATYTVSNLSNHGWHNTTAQSHTLYSGWQLVSNPYLATLNISSAPTGFDNQILVWRANGTGAGSYETLMAGSNAVIAPFQAFLVHVSANNSGPYTYTIKASDRTLSAQTFYIQNDNQLDIVAQNTGTGLLDKTTVAFNTNATDTFDTQFDANKSAGSLNRHTIYTLNNNYWMSINTLHDVASTNTVPVGFEPGANGNYSFAFNNINTFDATSYIYLEDLQQHIMFNVRNGNYMFSADSADDWNRFVLHFTAPAVISSTDAGCNTLGAINVTQPGSANWTYTLTNGSNLIASGVLNQNAPISINQPAGTYTLTLVDNNNYTVTKVIQVNGSQPVTAAFSPSVNTITTQTQVSFINTSQDANSFTWNFGDGSTSNLVSPLHTYATAGLYTVQLNAANTTGCTAVATQLINVTNPTTAINAVTENGITMWSSANKLYIDFSQLSNVDAKIKVYDVLGQELLNDEFTSSVLYQKEIGNTNASCVIVSVKNGGQITTQKLFLINTK